jgi:GR25 family glycosyltransferase involved in LPS biosynthesis
MKPDKIYIVHYTKLNDRYNHLIPFLENCKIPYEFIKEYDQEELNEDILRDFYLADKNKFEDKIKNLWDKDIHKFRILNKPEISCTIKHLTAIKKVSLECKNFGLILEDDVLFYDDFNKKYKLFFENTPKDWDSIFLGDGCGVNFQSQILLNSKKVNDYSYLMSHPATNCAEAYLLKPNVARTIYENSLPFQLVSDWELAYQFYKINARIYWWYPSLVTQGSRNGKYNSTLDLGQRT